ncbi:MAG: substrate-binding domain-containing protein [Deinococcota bacterium]
MNKQERQSKILETVRGNGVDVLSTRNLAEVFDVSEITIRRDLQDLASEGLIQRQHGGVSTPQVQPATLTQVGILLASRHGKFSHPFFNKLLEGADSKLQDLSLHAAFVKTFAEVDTPEAVEMLLKQHPIEGLMVFGGLNSERVARWQTHVKHIVMATPQLPGFDCVVMDGYNGIQLMIDHLISLGYTRLGFIVGRSLSGQLDDRLEGYLAGLAKHQLEADPDLIFEMPHELELFPSKIGQQGAEQFMSSTTPPEVIVCASDMIALGVMQWLRDNNYRIPEDVAVTGFDDISEARRTFPPLTTVKVYKKLMGSLVAELLKRRIDNPDDPTITTMTPCSLIVRHSCGSN